MTGVLYVPPGAIAPIVRDGATKVEGRVHWKVMSLRFTSPDAVELFSNRSSTFDPSQPSARVARHWTSRPSDQRRPVVHSCPCQALAARGAARAASMMAKIPARRMCFART